MPPGAQKRPRIPRFLVVVVVRTGMPEPGFEPGPGEAAVAVDETSFPFTT